MVRKYVTSSVINYCRGDCYCLINVYGKLSFPILCLNPKDVLTSIAFLNAIFFSYFAKDLVDGQLAPLINFERKLPVTDRALERLFSLDQTSH